MNLLDWLEQHRFVTLSLVLLVIFLSIMSFLWIKADEVTKDPCSVCAKKHGSNVYCTLQGEGIPITRFYLANGSYSDNSEDIKAIINSQLDKREVDNRINLTDLKMITS